MRPLADHVLLRLLLLLLLHVLEVLLLHGGRRWPAAALPCAVAVEQLVGARDGVAAVVADDGRILCDRKSRKCSSDQDPRTLFTLMSNLNIFYVSFV